MIDGRVKLDIQYNNEPGYATRVHFVAQYDEGNGFVFTAKGQSFDEALRDLEQQILRHANT